MTGVTFHEVKGKTLACDICSCVIDASEQGRAKHQAWHQQTADVIDLTGRVALELDRIAS